MKTKILSVNDFLEENQLYTMKMVYIEFERIYDKKHLLSCLSNIKAKLKSYQDNEIILEVNLSSIHETYLSSYS